MYGYTNNDPINFIDPEGKNGYVVAAVSILAGIAVYKIYREVKNDPELFNRISNTIRDALPAEIRDFFGARGTNDQGANVKPIVPKPMDLQQQVRAPASVPTQSEQEMTCH